MALEKIDSAVSNLINQLSTIADKNVDKAALVAGHILQINAIVQLAGAFLAFVTIPFLFYVCPKLWVACDNIRDFDVRMVSRILLLLATAVSSLFCLIYGLQTMFNGFLWASAFDPYAALVTHFLKLI